jgi:hypothetical protein
MPKAGEVAIELRKLADSLDQQPDADITRPWVYFYGYNKKEFLSVVKILPRPLKKSISSPGETYARRVVTYENAIIDLKASVPQSLVCELLEPAKLATYRCEPLLSPDEDAELITDSDAS